MLMVISPAKRLDFSEAENFGMENTPQFADKAAELVHRLQRMNPSALRSLMGISENLAVLNHARYRDFFTASERPAILTFAGDVYRGLQARQFSATDLAFADAHLRILSGLYGVLRPSDKIRAHRLEMGTRLGTDSGEDLYDYWSSRIAENLNVSLSETAHPVLVNLASEEYFRAVRCDVLDYPVLHIRFKHSRGGRLRTIAPLAKRARGLMVRDAILRRVEEASGLRDFSDEGYKFAESLSHADEWVFVQE